MRSMDDARATGTLYLIPTMLGGGDIGSVLPQRVIERVRALRRFIAETPREARQFLKHAGAITPIQDLSIAVLNEHSRPGDIAALLDPLQNGHDVGLLSDAGCPAVADPGSDLIRLAHEARIPVVPLAGPSAILLALMASGLNGQRFTFHGYLPVDARERARRIRELEHESRERDTTQIFIEAPYRNQRMFAALMENCDGETRICIATDLTLAGESVHTRTAADWRKQPPDIHKRPAVFLLYAGQADRAITSRPSRS